MSLSDRMIGPCCIHLVEKDQVLVDTSALLRRLVLFDSYILQSLRFKEFPTLVRALGVEAVIRLLSSGVLKIECEPLSIGQSGNSIGPREHKRSLPKGSYSFVVVRGSPGIQYERYVHTNLAGVQGALESELNLKQIIRLKKAIVGALLPRRELAGQDALRQLTADLANSDPFLRVSLLRPLSREHRLALKTGEVKLTFTQLDDTDFRSESNLECFGLNEDIAHKAIESACLGVGGMNLRIEEMKDYSAVSGFIDSESSLLREKLGFVAGDLSPGTQELRVERVLSIKGLPHFGAHDPGKRFDADRFLEIRASKECRAFREWLKRIDSATNEEVSEQINSLRIRFADFAQARTGKAIRILISCIAGALPKIGPAAGLGVGILDIFVLERVLPESGPIAFLNRQYPSIFKAGRDRPE